MLSWGEVCRLLGYETPLDVKDEVMRRAVTEWATRESQGGKVPLKATDINQARVILEYFG